jgi:hypothetical protein
MHSEAPLSVVVVAMLGLAAGLPRPNPAPAVGVTATPVTLPDGSAGCNLTITASNSGTSNLKISNESQVRAKPSISPQYGTWKKLWSTNQFVRAGQKWSDVVQADFGCTYVRQYRFVVAYGGNEKAFTYPSSGGTKDETVSLGNLYTKFFD